MSGTASRLSVLAIALALAMLTIIVFTRPAVSEVSETSEQSAQADVQKQITAKYAAQFDVSKQEAIKQLELQHSVGKLNATLTEKEQGKFAGLYIDHEPEYRVVAKFTEDGKEEIEPYVDEGRLESTLEVTSAKATLEELEEAHARASLILEAVDVQADSWVDVENNLVKIHVADLPGLNKSLKNENLRFPDRVKVVEVPAPSVPAVNIFAGFAMSSGCTTGFSVKHSWGGRGVLTAGHCDNAGVRSRGLPLNDGTFDRFGGSYDMQFHRAPKHVKKPRVRRGGGYKVIKGTKQRRLQVRGQFACHTGRTTGTQCGTIFSNSTRPAFVPRVNTTWIGVRRKSKAALVLPGDSGGGWFQGRKGSGVTALGITSGYTPRDDLGYWSGWYMPINFAEKQGFTVLRG